MRLLGNKLFTLLMNAVYPRFCVGCNQEGETFCADCRTTWQAEPPLATDTHLALFAYANPVVRKLICAWKYHYDQSAWEVLQQASEEYLVSVRQLVHKQGITAIVPLPLSPRRQRERGFNQAKLLAEWLGRELQLPVIEPLARVHRQGHQAEKSTTARALAMEDSPFLLKAGATLPPAVLLVDDVWTTGSTLRAASRAFSHSQAVKIFYLTLAKG